MSFRVFVANTGATLVVPEETTILAAALEAGIAYPHGCRLGRCGSCKSRLIEGEVDLLPHTPFSLTVADKDQSLTLACRARPRSNCTVAWLGNDKAANAAETKPGG